MTAVVAIDPGVRGAIARYCVETDALELHDMPTLEQRGKNRVEPVRLAFLLQLMASRGADLFVVEQAGARPGQGGATGFQCGVNFGLVIGIVAALKVRCEAPAPALWKRAMRVTADKHSSIARATQMLPQHAHLWPLKRHEARCEAVLLALWGAQTFLAQPAPRPGRDLFAPGKDCTP